MVGICFVGCNLKINPVLTVSTPKLVSGSLQVPCPCWESRLLWKNSKQGAWSEASFCVNELGQT